MRKDGDWIFYQIEALRPFTTPNIRREWIAISNNNKYMVNVPHRFKYDGENYYTKKCKSYYEDFTASGKVWQETGYYGTYNIEYAIKMCFLLFEFNKGISFRVVKTRISQSRKQIAKFTLT